MTTIEEMRQKIDKIDREIVALLGQRMEAVENIGEIKESHHSAIIDLSREKAILKGIENEIPPKYLETFHKIYQAIFEASREFQQFNRYHDLPFQRIGIIGLVLIGGSICKALKLKKSSAKISTLAYEEKNPCTPWIDHIYSSLSEMISEIELIILASPISTIIPYAQELQEALCNSDQKLIVIDVASVKREIVENFEELSNDQIDFVGTHPMAGKEHSGFEHSEATLFTGRPWIVVPHSKNSSRNLQKVCSLIQFCGGIPFCLDPQNHDQQMALISHLPHQIAKSYYDFVKSTSPESLTVAGPGFASFSRIAHSNPTMHQEIASKNGEMISWAFNHWIEKIDRSMVPSKIKEKQS